MGKKCYDSIRNRILDHFKTKKHVRSKFSVQFNWWWSLSMHPRCLDSQKIVNRFDMDVTMMIWIWRIHLKDARFRQIFRLFIVFSLSLGCIWWRSFDSCAIHVGINMTMQKRKLWKLFFWRRPTFAFYTLWYSDRRYIVLCLSSKVKRSRCEKINDRAVTSHKDTMIKYARELDVLSDGCSKDRFWNEWIW